MSTHSIESAVIAELRRGSCYSRVQLSRQLSVSPSTIGIHVDRLLSGGYLLEAAKQETDQGRPPKRLELNPKAGQFIGVDLDAEEIRCVSVDFAQRLLEHKSEPIGRSDDAGQVMRRLQQAVASVRQPDRLLLGIGLAMPGTIDRKAGIGIRYPFIRGWDRVPLVEPIREAFDVPVSVENNIRAMALAERWFGRARDVDTTICIGVRSGIGSGVIIDGELYRGRRGLAGEIGGWPVRRHGELTTLESFASLRSMLGRSGGLSSQEQFLASAASGDPAVTEILHAAATEIARAIVQMAWLVDPDRVIICGPLAPLSDSFVDPLRDESNRLLCDTGLSLPIFASELGDIVGALGAAALPAQRWSPHM